MSIVFMSSLASSLCAAFSNGPVTSLDSVSINLSGPPLSNVSELVFSDGFQYLRVFMNETRNIVDLVMYDKVAITVGVMSCDFGRRK